MKWDQVTKKSDASSIKHKGYDQDDLVTSEHWLVVKLKVILKFQNYLFVLGTVFWIIQEKVNKYNYIGDIVKQIHYEDCYY